MTAPILIVDDNEMNLAILREILEEHYPLLTAEHGEEAIAVFEEHRPGVVLMDIMMPGLNGYDACKRIKTLAAGSYVQVILVSAKATPGERVKGYDAGSDDYIVKPFDADELLAKVRVHHRLYEAQSELSKAREAMAFDNGQLQSLVARQAQELVTKRDMLVFALANLADSRDPETGAHLQRMREYCKLMAIRLREDSPYAEEIDQAFLDAIYLAAPLHDIGKVGIPDAILLKPGRLTDDEFDLMKQHSVIGATALQDVILHGESGLFIRMAVDIARSHHERFDGKGYPDGLSGLGIPLSARICAVADVFDALTSVRVYKEAFSTKVAYAMVMQESGTQFDPVVIQAFDDCYETMVQIKEQIDRRTPAAQGRPAA